MWPREKSSDARQLILKQPRMLNPGIPIIMTGWWGASQIKGRVDHVKETASNTSHAQSRNAPRVSRRPMM